jgi:hypothetical protein
MRLTRSNPSTRHHYNVNSLPAPSTTTALQSHKCTSDKSIRACICITTVEGHITFGWPSINLHPCPQNNSDRTWKQIEGLDPEVNPTRRQLHNRKLKLLQENNRPDNARGGKRGDSCSSGAWPSCLSLSSLSLSIHFLIPWRFLWFLPGRCFLRRPSWVAASPGTGTVSWRGWTALLEKAGTAISTVCRHLASRIHTL